MEMRYIYSQKRENNNEITFKALKVKDKVSKETTLYPIIKGLGKDDETFIYGQGWVKITPKKTVEVPYYDNDTEHWDEYLNEYGIRCLFYSIYGKEYDSHDCTILPMQREFNSLFLYGIEKYPEFVSLFMRLREIQDEKFKEYGISDKFYIKDYIFYPLYQYGYGTPCRYTMDVLGDDEKLESLFRFIHKDEMFKESADYSKLLNIREEKDGYINKLLDKYDYHPQPNEISFSKLKSYMTFSEEIEWDRINREEANIYWSINKEVCKQLNAMIDDGTFPIQMKERIKTIYGDECAEIYEKIIKDEY